MSSIQKTITFPTRKRVSRRLEKKVEEKENDKERSNSNHKKTSKRSQVCLSLIENNCSPPKITKNNESSTEVDFDIPEKNKVPNLGQAIRVLHSSQPEQLHGRVDKIEKIKNILLNVLKTRESTTLYISGPPGTGKTACVNHIISLNDITGHFKIVYLNCTGLKSANAAYKRIAEGLKLKVGTSEKKTLEIIRKHLCSSQKIILMILDEMDQLESKKQSLLYTIFEWPMLFQTNFVLLGIANALDLTDRVLPRLQAKLDILPTLINFPAYSREEIVEIISDRLKKGGAGDILKGGALHMLASKVAAVSGDIRKALDIGRRVIEITQNKDDGKKEVSLQDVLSVVNNVYGTSSTLICSNISENGESFPLHQKFLICTMILIKKNSKSKEITIGRLHDVYKRICGNKNMTAVEISEFLGISELVESRGAIKIQGKTRNRLSKVLLLWDEGEIENALQDKQLLASILEDISCLK